MQFIPAIDIKDGKCVRLRKGLMSDCKQYAMSASSVIETYGLASAKCLHIVDLDGAINGFPCNSSFIKDIALHFDGFMQVGGGIRTLKDVQFYLSMGITRVVLGTSLLEEPKFISEMCDQYPGRICISIDTVSKYVVTRGWTNVSKIRFDELSNLLSQIGASCLLWTNVNRDGMMTGLDFQMIKYIIKSSPIPVVISGGIASVYDLIALQNSFSDSLAGVICGTALYERSFPLSIANQIFEASTD
ncbi:MAG: HisA/HisF-related TIM barrel protein [Candidatus Hodgkinia cicadicola]